METGNGRELFRPAAYCSPDGAGQAGGVLAGSAACWPGRRRAGRADSVLAGPTACWPGRQRAPPLDSVLPHSTACFPTRQRASPLDSAHPQYPATPMFSRHNIEDVRCPRAPNGRICGKCGRTSRLSCQATTHFSGIMPRVRGHGRIPGKCADPGAPQPAGMAGYPRSALSRGHPNRRAWQDVGEVRRPGGRHARRTPDHTTNLRRNRHGRTHRAHGRRRNRKSSHRVRSSQRQNPPPTATDAPSGTRTRHQTHPSWTEPAFRGARSIVAFRTISMS